MALGFGREKNLDWKHGTTEQKDEDCRYKALPWSVIVAMSFPFAFVVGLCGFLFCRCCVSCIFGRLVDGWACPCPPLLVGLLLWLVLLFVLGFWFCLVLSCGCPPLWPPHPWRLVVLISGSERLPSGVSVWISGCFGNGLGIWSVCLTSCLLLTSLEMEISLLPCVFVLYGNKGFGPVWGTALYTMLLGVGALC